MRKTVRSESVPGHLQEFHPPDTEAILHELTDYGVSVVGLTSSLNVEDSSPSERPFPHTIYHGYFSPNDDPKKISEFFNQPNDLGAGGEFLGKGLYGGSQYLAELYRDKAAQGRVGGHKGVVEAIAVNAHLLDLDSPQARKRVPDSFLRALEDFSIIEESRPINATELISPDEPVARLQSVARARELLRTAGFSLFDFYFDRGLRGQHDGFMQDFLNKHLGIDGAILNVVPSVDAAGIQKIACFWSLDHIGDKELWQARNLKLAEAARATVKFAHAPVVDLDTAITQAPEQVRAQKQLGRRLDTDDPQLTLEEARTIKGAVADGTPLLSVPESRTLAEVLLSSDEPYTKVRRLSEISPVLRRLLTSSVGVWEGYAQHEHIQANLGQFRTLYRNNLFSDEEPGQLKLAGMIEAILCLQDIGKPLAALEGDKKLQTEYNASLAANLLAYTPLSPEAQQLIVDIVGQNFIGDLLVNLDRTDIDYDHTAQNIAHLINRNKSFTKSTATIWTMLRIAYTADASSYTSTARYRDAQGNPHYARGGLDPIFQLFVRSRRPHIRTDLDHILQRELAPRIDMLLSK